METVALPAGQPFSKWFLFIAISSLLVSLAFVALALRYGMSLKPELGIAWFVTSLALLVLSLFGFLLVAWTSYGALRAIEISGQHSVANINKTVRDHLTPSIIPLPDKAAVRLEVAGLFEGLRRPDALRKEVVYFGAASLHPAQDEIDAILARFEMDKGNRRDAQLAASSHPALIYQNAYSQLRLTPGVQFSRYVRLVTAEEFGHRGDGYRAGYLSWLSRQIEEIENPSTASQYILYKCTRAPEFGATRSAVLTKESCIDIIGRAEAGILVRGQALSDTIKDRTIDYFNAAEPANRPTPFTRGNVAELKKLLDDCLLIHKKRRG